MMGTDDLYDELRPEFQLLATPLLQFSVECIRKRGEFMPHGAVLSSNGQVTLCAAAPEDEEHMVSATDVLPLLHEGIRASATRCDAKVVGVAESVTVTLPGQRSSLDIKVLMEHQRGMTVAVYVKFRRKLFGGYAFEKPQTTDAPAEITPWTIKA